MLKKLLILTIFVAGMLLAQKADRVMGAVESVDAAGGALTIKTDDGKQVHAKLDAKARVLRVEPGEKDFSKAQPMEFSAVGVGDRVIARGALSEQEGTLAANMLVVMSKSAIADKNSKEQAEWRKNGLRGVVKSVDASAHEIHISARGSGTDVKDWTVTLPPSAVLKRYASNSVKFSDATVEPLDAIEAGDQIRVLGERDDAQSKVAAQQVVSGSFRTIGGEVVSVKADLGEVTLKDVQTKKNVVIRLTADTNIRRMPNFGGMRPGGGAPGGAAAGAPGGAPGGGAPGGPAPGGAPAGGSPGGAPGGGGNAAWGGGNAAWRGGGAGGAGGTGGMAGRTPDLAQMVDRLPKSTLAELQPGDAVIIAVAREKDNKPASVITLVAGVDFLLRESAAQVNRTLGNWNTEMSMPGQ
jgi:hypothetical protein